MPQKTLAWKLRRAALAGAVGATLVLAGSIGSAIANDDDDELLDVKILRGFLSGLGLKRPGDDQQIEYRERSPLVVPPTRDLPPPETTSSIERNPAWPADKDAKRRAEAAAQPKKRKPVNWEEEARPLSPSQLGGTGTPPPASTQQASGASASTTDRMSPSELGYKGGLFSFGSFFGFNKEEYAKFDREPPRAGLTDPPPGYRTPSPDQPYGVRPSNEPSKPLDPNDRPVGVTGTRP